MNKKQTKKQTIFSKTKNTRGSEERTKGFSKNNFKNNELQGLPLGITKRPSALMLPSGRFVIPKGTAEQSRL
jgi:hypothetical protein